MRTTNHADLPTLIFLPMFILVHTCDNFQKGIREVFFSFQGGLSNMYGINRVNLTSDEGDFEISVKSCMF